MPLLKLQHNGDLHACSYLLLSTISAFLEGYSSVICLPFSKVPRIWLSTEGRSLTPSLALPPLSSKHLTQQWRGKQILEPQCCLLLWQVSHFKLQMFFPQCCIDGGYSEFSNGSCLKEGQLGRCRFIFLPLSSKLLERGKWQIK